MPITATRLAPARASCRVATTDAAAVRISVSADALITASGSPVCALDSSTTPWWASSPAAGLPGMMQIALRLNAASPPGRAQGISAISPLAPGGLITVRSGWCTSPQASAASPSATSRAQSGWGRSSCTSRALTTSSFT